jgi:hypothetical protein
MILIGDIRQGTLAIPNGTPGQAFYVGYVEDYQVYINGEHVGEADNAADAIRIATEAYRRTLQ